MRRAQLAYATLDGCDLPEAPACVKRPPVGVDALPSSIITCQFIEVVKRFASFAINTRHIAHCHTATITAAVPSKSLILHEKIFPA
jgi:hypothetical protein